MPLESGNYLINDLQGNPIARRLTEDKPLEPQAIVKHANPIPPEAAMWNFQQLIGARPNTFILSNRGNYTVELRESVWAIIIEGGPPPEEWVVEDGPGGFVILTSNKRSGWMVPEGPRDQIECRPLIVEPSVFTIVPANRD